LSTTSTLIDFQEDIQQFIPQVETGLKGKALVGRSTTILNDKVQRNVKRNLILLNQNQFLNKNPPKH
jgi:hypothetical protein